MYIAIFIKIPLLPVTISSKNRLTLDHCEGEIETKYLKVFLGGFWF
jgi:hypothetical protein